jgi:hypothetical protein
MEKSIAREQDPPDWVDEIELKEGVHNLAKDFSDMHIRAKRLKEIA